MQICRPPGLVRAATRPLLALVRPLLPPPRGVGADGAGVEVVLVYALSLVARLVAVLRRAACERARAQRGHLLHRQLPDTLGLAMRGTASAAATRGVLPAAAPAGPAGPAGAAGPARATGAARATGLVARSTTIRLVSSALVAGAAATLGWGR